MCMDSLPSSASHQRSEEIRFAITHMCFIGCCARIQQWLILATMPGPSRLHMDLTSSFVTMQDEQQMHYGPQRPEVLFICTSLAQAFQTSQRPMFYYASSSDRLMGGSISLSTLALLCVALTCSFFVLIFGFSVYSAFWVQMMDAGTDCLLITGRTLVVRGTGQAFG